MSLRGIKGRLAKVEAKLPKPTVEITIVRSIVEPNQGGGLPVKIGELRRKARAPANVADAIERGNKERGKEFVESLDQGGDGEGGGAC
jgi:hypothetical protein